MTYNFYANPKATPQTEPIPGRESEMIKSRSGAVAFKAGDFEVLRRCLITGTSGGSFYAGKQELTQDFVEILKRCLDVSPDRVADDIVYASEGHAINNSAPIFALAVMSTHGSHESKRLFRYIFPKVIRTGSHFHEWLSYTKGMRGMGRVIREVATAWLSQDIKFLTYQMLKYNQRYGFSFRDELRLFKPKPQDEHYNFLYGYMAGKTQLNPNLIETMIQVDAPVKQIAWYEKLKANPELGVEAVKSGRLTHEMVAPIANMDKNVWQALFESMPVTALIRNLANLTEHGVISMRKTVNTNRIEQILCDPDILRKALIHPFDLLKALKVYASGGNLGLSKKTWVPVPRVIDILERSLELSFHTQTPNGLVYLHAVDISGSMSCTWSVGNTAKSNDISNQLIRCSEVAALMALVSAKTEPNYLIRGFSTKFVDLGITAKDSFQDACKKVRNQNFGGTDASVAYDWAIANNIYADVICFWSDGESWAGRRHPAQALQDYRSRVNPNAKAIYVNLVPNLTSLADPKDPNTWDLSGFDPSAPGLIQQIATGSV